MSQDAEDVSSGNRAGHREASFEEYVVALQSQIVEIINKVKEETGVDLPVDIKVRKTEDE